ncbi:hypothetical protein ACA910_005258 [Epithemia clementina (nom. ined.)]
MKLMIYLDFDGTCAQAFDFYKCVFKCDTQDKTTFAMAKEHCKIDPEDANRIMHISLPISKEHVLMGRDSRSTQMLKVGNNFHLMLHADSKVHADDIFAALSSDGGLVHMEMKDQFWGAYYGTCTDRFGVHWMIHHCHKYEDKEE